MAKFIKKKSLGQNFLRDKNALLKIVDAAEITENETVLEIGPGEGNLTEELLARGSRVIAVEKDDRLISVLQEKFASQMSSGKFTLVHADILFFHPNAYGLEPRAYFVIANIPYYITGEIIRKALSEWPQPKKAVLLVQKEVAERICSKDGKESILSISVKAYGNPKIAGIVKAGAFSPSPKVDSAILLISNISKNSFENVDEQRFFEIVKTGFAHKRKIVSANLRPIFGENTEKILTECEIDPQSRAETLSLAKWLSLAAKPRNTI